MPTPETSSLTAAQRRWLLEKAHQHLDGTAKLPDDPWAREFIQTQLGFVRRMRRRFPDGQTWLWSDRSLAQASDWWSAQYKAALFPPGETVADVCCGAGVDTTAIALRGPVIAQDADAYLLDLTRSNAEARLETSGRVRTLHGRFPGVLPTDAEWMHADPDRRATQTGQDRKTLNADQFEPNLADLLNYAASLKGAVIKLAPLTMFTSDGPQLAATDFDQTPILQALTVPWRRIWLSSYDECRQQLLVLGDCCPSDLSSEHNRAVLCHPVRSEFTGNPQLSAEVRLEPRQFIYDLHPCLGAASLKGAWAQKNDVVALADHRGYYTSDEAIESPFAQRLKVIDVLPWDDRKVRKWLRKYGAGVVEVKCRLAPVDATAAQKRYSRESGNRPVTLVVTRIDKRVRAIACTRA